METVRNIRNWPKCYKDMYDNILDRKIAHIIQCVDAPNNTLLEIIDKIRKEYPSIDPELVQIIILGLAFKENCPDLRNTRVVDIIAELKTFGARIEVYDPWVDREEAQRYYGVDMIERFPQHRYDALILAMAHQEFTQLSADALRNLCHANAVIYDVKHCLPQDVVDGSL